MTATDGERAERAAAQAEVVFRARGVSKIFQVGDVEVHTPRKVDIELFRGELGVLGQRGGFAAEIRESLSAGEEIALYPSVHLADGVRIRGPPLTPALRVPIRETPFTPSPPSEETP